MRAGALKGRFVEGIYRAALATVRERKTFVMTLAELARVSEIKGDKHRWIRHEQHKEKTKEREALAKDNRLRRQARLATALRVSGEARAYPPREAPVRVVGAVNDKT